MIGLRSAGAFVSSLIGAVTGFAERIAKPAPRLRLGGRKASEAERFSTRVRKASGPEKQRLIRDRAYKRRRLIAL